jgi:hypothetical protein
MKNPAWRPNLHDRQESRKKREAAELAALFCAARAARNSKCCVVIFCPVAWQFSAKICGPCKETALVARSAARNSWEILLFSKNKNRTLQ